MKSFTSAQAFAARSTRRYPRWIFSIPFTVRQLDTGGVRKLRGMTLDLSEGGMGALVQGILELGEAVEIDLHFEGQDLMPSPSFVTPAACAPASNSLG